KLPDSELSDGRYLYRFLSFPIFLNLDNSALLLMSSGNYGGLNFDEVKGLIN
ncbi:MAG: UDP-N-acetylmuramate: L-alanyl-gamma-D-glutamyl-meso-diaminopimelate ligase, partial [Bacteroidota bacterium]|nr:UDP-N-acetylmuramate: L-alanyl-gamma-D-glutamyl-meso-diaminopimelate ligase [Bacteroidota bacterium]